MIFKVDDFALYRFFTQRYGSIRCAKVRIQFLALWIFITSWAQVVLDESGFSKGYGFVRCVQAIWTGHFWLTLDWCEELLFRFGSEAEQQHALGSMTGEMGLGSKPIKVQPQKSQLSSLQLSVACIIHWQKVCQGQASKTKTSAITCQEKSWQSFFMQPNQNTNFPAGVNGQPKEPRRKWSVIDLFLIVQIVNLYGLIING